MAATAAGGMAVVISTAAEADGVTAAVVAATAVDTGAATEAATKAAATVIDAPEPAIRPGDGALLKLGFRAALC
jgi:hypothetical protein